MNVVYLKDGTKCHLHEKTEKGYVVEAIIECIPHEYYEGSCDVHISEPSGYLHFVEKVYKEAPRAEMDKYIKGLQKISEDLFKQKAIIKEEIKGLNRTREILLQSITDAENMIINKRDIRNAKRLVVWVAGKIKPLIMDNNNDLKLSISYTIHQFSNNEKCWAYQLNYDKEFSRYSEYFDEKYGIKCDPTDTEILDITHRRQRELCYNDCEVLATNDIWLIPDNITRKRNLEAQEKINSIEDAKKALAKALEKYNALIADTVVS